MDTVRYVIVEDERLAYEEMRRMMASLRPEYVLAGWADSVEQAAVMLSRGDVALILLDINLSDGTAFDIFRRMEIDIPVIFTTAYDEYAIRAFRVNSVDYLLKPIEEDDLERALCKFERNASLRTDHAALSALERDITAGRGRRRFMVQTGDSYRWVDIADVAYFLSEDKYTFLYRRDGRRHIINYSLDAVETMVDRHDFMRVSRNCVAGIGSVVSCARYFGSRLRLHMQPDTPEAVIVSRTRVADVLRWIDGVI